MKTFFEVNYKIAEIKEEAIDQFIKSLDYKTDNIFVISVKEVKK